MGKLGDHHIQRANAALKATKAYKEAIDTYLRESLASMAYMIVNSAWRLRMNNAGAHNFTGNLVNSICAGVYYKGLLDAAYFSYELPGVEKPIMKEMTTKGGVAKTYVFSPDYSGADSKYKAEVATDESYGHIHAMDFVEGYTPKSNYLEIVLAYTVEYAQYVENNRTLGYEMAYKDFNQMWLALQNKIKTGAKFGYGNALKYVNVTAK